MLAQAGQVSVQLVDSIMVGHVGTSELAAASFSGSVFIIGFVFGMGFTFGVTPLVGKAFGEKNEKRVGDLLRDSFILNSLVSIVLALLLYALSFLMPYMGQPQAVVDLAIPYYRILVLSILPFLMFFTLKQFLEGLGKTKVATIITLTANVINVIVNFLLIYGLYGFPELGLNGAGYGTLVARLFMPLLLILWFVKSEYYVKYKPYLKLEFLQKQAFYKLFKFNLPIGLQIIVEVVAFAFGGLMMGWFGEVALAAHQIALGLASFTFMIASGIGSATTIRISYQLGDKQYLNLKRAGFASIHLVTAFMGSSAILFLIFRSYLPMMFTSDGAVIELAAHLLLFAAIFQIVDGIQLVSISALRGLSDVNFALWVSVLSYGVFALFVSYFAAFQLDFGPGGIWMGFVVGLSFASMVFLKRFTVLSNRLLQ
jgi:MATE family multidrug resistance protein